MKELYQKINKEIESSGKYEFATAELLNALLFKFKSPDSIEEDFKKLRSDYNHYWDLIDELNIEDDLREILTDLFHKINTYNIIDALLEVTKHKDRILALPKKYKKYFMPVLKAIYDKPGITDVELEKKLETKKNKFAKLLGDLYRENLISKTYDDINNISYYFLTAMGIRYFKLLNKESIKND